MITKEDFMKKIIISLIVFLLSIQCYSQYFSFPVNSISVHKNFDAVFILESSEKMRSYSDRIYLDCQGFLAQLAFYKGENSSPEEIYDLDHSYCEYMVNEISRILDDNKKVCLSLNIEEYELPLIQSGKCEVDF